MAFSFGTVLSIAAALPATAIGQVQQAWNSSDLPARIDPAGLGDGLAELGRAIGREPALLARVVTEAAGDSVRLTIVAALRAIGMELEEEIEYDRDESAIRRPGLAAQSVVFPLGTTTFGRRTTFASTRRRIRSGRCRPRQGDARGRANRQRVGAVELPGEQPDRGQGSLRHRRREHPARRPQRRTRRHVQQRQAAAGGPFGLRAWPAFGPHSGPGGVPEPVGRSHSVRAAYRQVICHANDFRAAVDKQILSL
nr:hypothetical protein [Fodinicola feengrottensis]